MARTRPLDRQREGVQHHFFGLHPGDAAPAARVQYRDRDRRHPDLYRPGAAERRSRLDLLRADPHRHPYIIDLKDTKEHKDVGVNIGPVSEDQLKLFLAIEEPEKVAKDYIDPDKLDKYFPKSPFANWGPKQPLPMFGTIGWMYQCYKNYLDIEYSDGSTLWEALYSAGQKKGAQQNDLFNKFVAGGQSDARVHGLRVDRRADLP